MFRFATYLLPITVGLTVLGSIAWSQSEPEYAPVSIGDTVVNDLRPFTHTVLIPAGSDLSSIRFQDLKSVTIPTRSRSTTNEDYCREAVFRDSGGSAFCPLTQFEAFVRAYRVTYSYEGPPLASDEYGNRRFTFNVYFRFDELGLPDRAVGAPPKKRRAEAAGLFQLTASRESSAQLVIDEDNSTLCQGPGVDGLWVHANPKCEDRIKYKTVTVPSDYIRVRVEPVAAIAVDSSPH
jgi:hypothetical protein